MADRDQYSQHSHHYGGGGSSGQRGGYPPASYGYANDNEGGYRANPERTSHNPTYTPATSAAVASSTPNFRWFIPGSGIRRDVIQADIQRYLGPEALVRPGEGRDEHRGRSGFWIAAYRTLTPAMIDDLRADSANFERSGDRGRYEDSMIHRSRQHWGPTAPQPSESPAERPQRDQSTPYSTSTQSSGYSAGYSAPSSSGYSSDVSQAQGQHYTHYAAGAHSAAPQYPAYAQEPVNQPHYQDPRAPRSSTQQQPRYSDQPSTTPGYGSTSTATSRPTAPPGMYLASDGRYYPESQRPT